MMRKFFFKRFRTFFLIMLIPTIIFMAIFTFIMGKNFNSKLITQGETSMSSVRTNFDVVVKNAVYQQALMTTDNRMILSLKKLIQSGGSYDYSDSVFLDDLNTFLRSVIYAHSYIDSIYIALDGYDYFFSSTQGGLANLSTYYDTDWYQDYRKDTQLHYQWIVKRQIKQYTYTTPRDVLTVFQRMSSGNGVIVINIDMQKFIHILGSIVPDKNEYVYMLNRDGSLLLSNKENSGLESEVKNGFFSRYLSTDKSDLAALSGRWIRIGNKQYLVTALNYAESQSYFMSLISDDAMKEQFRQFILTFVLMLAGNCLVVAFISYFTTSRIFRQINYMVKTFSSAENGVVPELPKKGVKDEYDVIMNNIIHLYLKNTHMKNELTERQHTLEVTELMALQLQINPHFLLNTLQTMDFEARKQTNGSSSLNDIIHDLSDILKYALADPEKKVSLRQELDYLKEYVSIQKYRFGDRFVVYYEADDSLMDYQVFRLLLQPLLENSISHGIRGVNRKGFIKIRIYRRENMLNFRVIDNGVGLTREEVARLYQQINDKNSRSIGLTNVNRRLVLEYGDDCGLQICSKRNYGTRVSFKIPIQ